MTGEANPNRWFALLRSRVLWLMVGLFAAGTIWFWTGTMGSGRPTSTLTADARYYYVYAPSLFIDHDLDLANQYQQIGNYYQEPRTATGRFGNSFGVGPALFHAPLFAAGHVLAWIAGARADGSSEIEQRATLYASFLYGFLAFVLMWRLCRRRVPEFAALAGALGAAAGGPLLWYALRQPGYSHPVATATVAALLLAWDRTREGRTLRGWLVCGALAGAVLLARPQNLTWCVVLVVDAGFAIGARLRARDWRGAARACIGPAAGAAVALVVFLPQMLVWHALYGSLLTVPQGESFMRWGSPSWSETLFSSRNGLFPWSPVLWLAAIACIVLVKRERRVGLTLLGGFLLTMYVNGAVWDWWAGGSFGGRRYDGALPLFALALAHGLEAARAFFERHQRALVYGVLGGALAMLLAMNCEQAARNDAFSVTRGSSSLRGLYGGQLTGLETRVYDVVGNPLSAPANWLFAWRYGVPVTRYDEVVGTYFLNDEFLRPTRRGYKVQDELRFGAPEHARFLVSGLAVRREGALMTGREAHVLVPLNQPGGLTLQLGGVAPAGTHFTLSWNGAEVGSGAASGAGQIAVQGQVAAGDVRRGINEVTITASPAGTAVLTMLAMAPATGP